MEGRMVIILLLSGLSGPGLKESFSVRRYGTQNPGNVQTGGDGGRGPCVGATGIEPVTLRV